MSTTDNRSASDLQLKKVMSATWLHVLLSTVAFAMCIPFLWMVLTSLKPVSEIGLDAWLPSKVATATVLGGTVKVPQNYADVFDYDNPDLNRRGIRFAQFYWNSIFITSWVTFMQVVTSSMAAYAFARLAWPGRDRVFLMYLGTMMLPGLVMMIPNYQIMINLGLVDTMPGLILPAAFSAFGTFMLRQFMLTVPASLDEAAEIDGASKWRIFWDIILPMSRPGIITLSIFTFMGNYNSFFWPLVMLKTEARYTLPIGLMYFDSSRGQSTHLLMAAVTMSVLPMILIFVVLQKYLVRGIQLGAVKG
jgi:multiple sugar transport system permease protein